MNNIVFMPREFLSTLSLRRATEAFIILAKQLDNFYPRSPCGERRATSRPRRQSRKISIHALLAESDCGLTTSFSNYLNFYPRSPCGERPWPTRWPGSKSKFLSTLSLRRATRHRSPRRDGQGISIHALLAESDMTRETRRLPTSSFLSTLSLRRATLRRPHGPPRRGISIHALLAESDNIINSNRNFTQKFLSTLSLRRATH